MAIYNLVANFVAANVLGLSVAGLALAVGHVYMNLRPPSNKHRPPGPSDDQAIEFRTSAKSGKMKDYTFNLIRSYNPENGIVCFKLLNRWVYVLADAVALKEVLKNPCVFQRSLTFQGITREIGTLLFGMEGEQWKLHRKIIQPAFSPQHLRQYILVFMKKSHKLFDAWAATETVTPEVFKAMSALALDNLGQAMYSFDYEALDSVINPSKSNDIPMEAYINTITKGMQRRMGIPSWIPNLFRNYLLKDDAKEYAAAVDAIRKISIKAVERKLSNRSDLSSNDTKDKNSMDLIDFLLSNEAQGKLTMSEIADETWGFYLAGHETTSSQIVLAIKSLCDNPFVVTRLQTEIDSLFSSTHPTPECMVESLDQCPLLDAFLYEVRRFYPVIPVISRQVVQHDAHLLGYHLPNGSIIMMHFYGAHHSAKYWDNPDEFSIDRWLNVDEEVKRNMKANLLSFGEGPHMCIGQKFALLEIKVVLLLFLKRFIPVGIVNVDGKTPMLTHTMTMGYKDGLYVELKRRQ